MVNPLSELGRALVVNDALVHCDAALVLSGEDGDGLRVRAAAELYRGGWVSKVALSGSLGPYGTHECAMSGPIALSLGVRVQDLVSIPHAARSTREEAELLLPALISAGIRSVILVTSNFHTRRARAYFRAVFGDQISVIVRAAPHDWYDPDEWWKTREGLKYFVHEAAKLILEWRKL
jgi:uncharacterized SAM-binding protein YcdF (DUF218 family)